MHLNLQRSAVLALAVIFVPPALFAEHHESEAAPSGFRADFLMDMGNMQKKVAGLAEAVPADKYAWAPTPEVRNLAASYVHMAQANHQILQAFGVEPPAGLEDMETRVMEKADVQAALEASFAAVKQAVTGMPDEDLETMVSFFGREWSKRQVLMLIAGHCHEHLGQAIVYARSVGVVPPWSRPRDDSGNDGDG
jgi:uncharacterized damage-inducible protein DinB